MKLKLYKNKLEDEALIVLNSNFEILEINSLAMDYFQFDSPENKSSNFFDVIEEKSGVSNIKELLEHSFKSNMQIKVNTFDDKTLLIKSLILHEKSLLSIFVVQTSDDEINSLIDSYIKSEGEALLYLDELSGELFFTERFLGIFDLKYNEIKSYRVFLLKILRQVKNSSALFTLLKNKFKKHDEFLGIIELKNDQKIEYVYKKYEFGNELRGILCNFTPIDREIQRISYDHTSELLERKLLLDEMDFIITEANKHNKKTALLTINLTAFKKINEIYGLKMGNFVLKKIARRLKQTLRKNDIIGRYSADEFVILLNNFKEIEFLNRIINRLLEKVMQSIKLHNRSIYISSVAGLVICDSSLDFDTLLKKSFEALNYAKKSGYKFSIYNKDLENQIEEKIRIEQELKEAVKNEDFIVYYQPQISTKTGNIIGVEALARWRDKDGNIINPGVFIPIAEDVGFIKDIEKIILKKAILEAEPLLKKHNLKLALNLSIKQFLERDYIDLLAKYGKSKDFLEIEITESTAIMDLDESINLINDYKKLGVTVAIDDFGIGYSSLGHLKNLPIDKIKIDKSFVDNIVNSKGDKALVQAVMLIAETLDLEVIAEGVEYEEQFELLKDLGVSLFQGYYFDEPLSFNSLTQNIEKNVYKLNKEKN